MRSLRLALPLLVTMLSLSRAAAAQSRACVVRGTPDAFDTLHVTVRAGAASRVVRVGAVPLVIEPGTTESTSLVHARGALEFTGTSDAVPYAIAGRGVVAMRGMVRLSREAFVQSVRAQGDGRAVIAVGLGAGVTARNVVVPCARLTVRNGERRAGAFSNPLDPRRWVPRARVITLRERPDGGGAVDIEVSMASYLPMRRIARRGPYALVAWRSARGEALRGWVRQVDIAPMQHAIGGIGDPYRVRVREVTSPTIMAPGVYHGPAVIAPGTRVQEAPSAGAESWALVRSSVGLRVMHRAGSEWVQITSAPGVYRGECEHTLCGAWVPRAAVRMP